MRTPPAKIFIFSSLAMPLGSLLIAQIVYLPPYFAGYAGLGLTTVGASFAIVRLLDVLVDPMLGFIMDRTSTRIGRYRFWIILGTPILMTAVYALFEAQQGAGPVYLTCWLLVFYLGTSIFTVGQSAWATVLAPKYDDRSRIFGAIAVFMLLGSVAVIMLPVVRSALGWEEFQATQAMGWLVFVTIPIVSTLACVLIRDPVSASKPTARISLRGFARLIVHPHMFRMLMVQIMLTLSGSWFGALFLFYFTASRGLSIEAASGLLLIYMLAGLLGAPLTALLATRINKHRTLMVNAALYSLSIAAMLLPPDNAFFLFAIPITLAGLANVGFDMMIRSMLADVADEVHLERKQDQTSTVYALNSSFNKLALAMTIGLSYPLLDIIGFDAALGAENTMTTLNRLDLLLAIGPVLFAMLGSLCLSGWKLDQSRHDKIRRELERHYDQHDPGLAGDGSMPARASASASASASAISN